MNSSEAIWQCPICQRHLFSTGNKWECQQNHSFDIARESYVNLLLPQQRNSKAPGDSKDMVVARREFLALGHYQALANKLAKLSLKYLHGKSQANIIDVGCGEAYYLNIINEFISQQACDVIACGVDISKPAIQKAAKTYAKKTHNKINFAVASNFELPLANKSQDLVLQTFAPSKIEELTRILKKDGYWLNVTPSKEHLFELKSLVYDNAQKHKEEDNLIAPFEIVEKQEIKYHFNLSDSQSRLNLLAMTPFYWTISEEKKKRLANELNSATAHFNIRVMSKNN